MNGRTQTGQARLASAIDAAHEAVQEAHKALYDVQLATERAENDALAGGSPRCECGAGNTGWMNHKRTCPIREYGEQWPIEARARETLAAASHDYARMRTEISELRPLLVPIVRWTQAAKREVQAGG